jgi:hypothetical protein
MPVLHLSRRGSSAQAAAGAGSRGWSPQQLLLVAAPVRLEMLAVVTGVVVVLVTLVAALGGGRGPGGAPTVRRVVTSPAG